MNAPYGGPTGQYPAMNDPYGNSPGAPTGQYLRLTTLSWRGRSRSIPSVNDPYGGAPDPYGGAPAQYPSD